MGKVHLQVLQGQNLLLLVVSTSGIQVGTLKQHLDIYMTWHSHAMGELGCVKIQSVVQRTAQLNRSAPALPGRVDWPSAPGLFCYSCCQGHCPEAAPQSGPCSAAGHAAEPSPYFALSGLAGSPQCGFVFAFRQDDKQLNHMLGTQHMLTDVTHGLNCTKDTCLTLTVQLVLFPNG